MSLQTYDEARHEVLTDLVCRLLIGWIITLCGAALLTSVAAPQFLATNSWGTIAGAWGCLAGAGGTAVWMVLFSLINIDRFRQRLGVIKPAADDWAPA
jgi:hypothetical protein